MARINFVVPPLDPHKFSGGILCILEYAKGLRSRGHVVTLTPLLPCAEPEWSPGDIGTIVQVPLPSGVPEGSVEGMSMELQVGMYLRYTREALKHKDAAADITLATSCITALPVHLYGSGARYYFAQHFEPYFSVELDCPRWWEYQALESYRLDLHLIANSSWLRRKLREELDLEAELCANAIDQSIFFGVPKEHVFNDEIKIISYGGRLAEWKGFREMAEGVRLARQRLPQIRLRWLVYGSSILKPENEVTPFESLGFLNQQALADAYRSADLLLSASWYESFPLFPLEAMACGLAVITTQPGTEEFAIHGSTAHIVQPRDPHSIADALVKLTTEKAYRDRLAAGGNEIAKRFHWGRAVDRMEHILLGKE